MVRKNLCLRTYVIYVGWAEAGGRRGYSGGMKMRTGVKNTSTHEGGTLKQSAPVMAYITGQDYGKPLVGIVDLRVFWKVCMD